MLDISSSGVLSEANISLLGKAIAFNARKGGVLEYVNLDSTITNHYNVENLYKGMNISEYDHENTYGDINKANKMQGEALQKIYCNNLKVLQLNRCNQLGSNFNMTAFKRQFKPADTDFIKLIARTKTLTSLQLSGCGLTKNDADLLQLSLDPTRAGFCNQIKILNLAKNNLQKEGMKSLAKIFSVNNIIEVIDVSKNYIGVSGA